MKFATAFLATSCSVWHVAVGIAFVRSPNLIYRAPLAYREPALQYAGVNVESFFVATQRRLEPIKPVVDAFEKGGKILQGLQCTEKFVSAIMKPGMQMMAYCQEAPDSDSDSAFKFEFPPGILFSPTVRNYLSQDHSVFLPELWNHTLLRRLTTRTVNLMYTLGVDAKEAGDSALDSQNIVISRPGAKNPVTTAADPYLASQWAKHTRRLDQSRSSNDATEIVARAALPTALPSYDPPTLHRRATTTPARTSRLPRTFSAPPSSRVIREWYRYYSELFIDPTSTTFASPSITSISYSLLSSGTFTLDVLYEGDPTPTITTYVYTAIYTDSSTSTERTAAGTLTTTSASPRPTVPLTTTSSRNGLVARNGAGMKQVAICLITVTVVLLDTL